MNELDALARQLSRLVERVRDEYPALSATLESITQRELSSSLPEIGDVLRGMGEELRTGAPARDDVTRWVELVRDTLIQRAVRGAGETPAILVDLRELLDSVGKVLIEVAVRPNDSGSGLDPLLRPWLDRLSEVCVNAAMQTFGGTGDSEQ